LARQIAEDVDRTRGILRNLTAMPARVISG